MFAVQINTASNYVIGFDVCTKVGFYQHFAQDPTRVFIDRSLFYSDAEVAAFTWDPKSYYLDELGILRKDYSL